MSFAAPILGGAALTGGHVSVAGTCMGVLLVALLTNALVLLQIDPFWVQLLLGCLILAAIVLNRWRESGVGSADREIRV
jgi:ribose transport system permease protein